MAAITAEQRAELVALFLTMFGQAPTTTQLARMVTARENGTSLLNIATSASVILESDFALVASMDAESFATYLTNALLASDIPASARTWATNWVITNVSGNKSKVQVIVEAVQAIRATTNTNYASSKAELAADVTAILTDINNPPVEVKTLTLTSNADTGAAFTGAGSDDVFVGQISGDLGLGTTFTAGDVLNGSSGVDTVNITVAGASTAAVTSTAVTLNNVEKVLVQNFDSNTDDTEDNEFNAALWTGVTTVGLSASTSTGDTSFTNLKNIVAAEMKNGNADLSVSYIAGVGAGTADTQTLALDGTTGGTFTASSAIETIAITATGASNTLAALAGTGANKLTINTAGALTITGALPTNIKTIDTSASAGGTSLVVGTADLTITGGAGNDSLRIDGATIDTNDTIDAGAGTDTLTLSGSIASAANGARVVNFENLRSYQDVTAADARTQDVSFISGITSVGVSKMTYTDDEDNTDDDVTVSSTFTNMAAGQTMVISGVSTATSDTNSTADQGDLTANVTFSLAADTTADSGTLTLGSVVGGAVSAATNQTITLNVTANDYETLTVVSNGASTSSNTIGTLTAGDATTLNITANRALTITTLTAAAVKNVDASASTANVTISSALSLASTIQGGAGNDTFTGSGLADSLNGGAGNDTLSAGVGNDTVDGGAGNDQITGGTGSDKLYGGAGNDTFTDATDGSDYAEGGDGDDTFVTSLANLTNADTIIGGAGTDTISINDAASVDLTADIIKLQNVSGVEVIGFSALNGSDTVTINDGVVSTAGGSLTLKFLTGVTGANTINASGVLASVSTVSFTDLAGLSTTYSIGNGKDNVSMGDAADTIVVSNTAYLAGTDSLDAGTGSDTLSFTNDTAATNTITVAQLAGVKGAETFSIDHATDTNLVNYAFTLDDATVGNQVAVGGTFTITRDAAEDGTLKVDGSAVTNSYALSLAGEDGNDTLTGGAGNDTISGRDGNDSLTGGGGNDVFVVTGLTQAANGSDTVTDFNFGTASTAVDTIQIDVTSTTKVFGRASTGITAAAGTEILILDQAAYQDASGAQTAAQTAFGANDNAAEAIVIWQDTLGNLNLSVYADASADATANGTLQTSMVRFSGLTLAGVQTLIDASDFTLI